MLSGKITCKYFYTVPDKYIYIYIFHRKVKVFQRVSRYRNSISIYIEVMFLVVAQLAQVAGTVSHLSPKSTAQMLVAGPLLTLQDSRNTEVADCKGIHSNRL